VRVAEFVTGLEPQLAGVAGSVGRAHHEIVRPIRLEVGQRDLVRERERGAAGDAVERARRDAAPNLAHG
jgi:hypothetical protein